MFSECVWHGEVEYWIFTSLRLSTQGRPAHRGWLETQLCELLHREPLAPHQHSNALIVHFRVFANTLEEDSAKIWILVFVQQRTVVGPARWVRGL